jgi:hypothetical protein
VPVQLPADVTAFTGREDELAALDDVLARAVRVDDGRTVVISAVSGTAGVGKTALAIRWRPAAPAQPRRCPCPVPALDASARDARTPGSGCAADAID